MVSEFRVESVWRDVGASHAVENSAVSLALVNWQKGVFALARRPLREAERQHDSMCRSQDGENRS